MYKTGPQILLPPLITCTGQLPLITCTRHDFPQSPPDYMYKKAEFPNIQPFLITCIRQAPKLLPCSDCAHKIALPPPPTNLQSFFITHGKHTESPATPDYADEIGFPQISGLSQSHVQYRPPYLQSITIAQAVQTPISPTFHNHTCNTGSIYPTYNNRTCSPGPHIFNLSQSHMQCRPQNLRSFTIARVVQAQISSLS